MSLEIRTLGPLFELCPDAVLCVEDGRIASANAAAELLFALKIGEPAIRYVPEQILNDPSEQFIATASVDDERYDVSVSRSGSISLLRYALRRSLPNARPDADRMLLQFGDCLLSTRLAVDAIVSGTHAESDEKLRQYASVLYQSYYRLKRLHRHMTLLHAMQSESLPWSPRLVHLETLCGELCHSVQPLIAALGVTLRYEPPDEPCIALADAGLLETMLLNLITNSLSHTAAGGSIRLSVSRQGRRFVIALDDPGSGIPPARLAELFAPRNAPALSEQAAGPGLGLMIVRGIAEKHDGTLILESREGIGTSVRVSLPEPGPESLSQFHQPQVKYRTDGMNELLTELSVVIDKSVYMQKYMD